VKYRTEKGLFKTVEDLTNVKGIGQKTVDKNKKDILLSDTPIDATTPSADSKAVTESKPVTEPSKDVKPK
jgi:competence protein ComEA